MLEDEALLVLPRIQDLSRRLREATDAAEARFATARRPLSDVRESLREVFSGASGAGKVKVTPRNVDDNDEFEDEDVPAPRTEGQLPSPHPRQRGTDVVTVGKAFELLGFVPAAASEDDHNVRDDTECSDDDDDDVKADVGENEENSHDNVLSSESRERHRREYGDSVQRSTDRVCKLRALNRLVSARYKQLTRETDSVHRRYVEVRKQLQVLQSAYGDGPVDIEKHTASRTGASSSDGGQLQKNKKKKPLFLTGPISRKQSKNINAHPCCSTEQVSATTNDAHDLLAAWGGSSFHHKTLASLHTKLRMKAAMTALRSVVSVSAMRNRLVSNMAVEESKDIMLGFFRALEIEVLRARQQDELAEKVRSTAFERRAALACRRWAMWAAYSRSRNAKLFAGIQAHKRVLLLASMSHWKAFCLVIKERRVKVLMSTIYRRMRQKLMVLHYWYCDMKRTKILKDTLAARLDVGGSGERSPFVERGGQRQRTRDVPLKAYHSSSARDRAVLRLEKIIESHYQEMVDLQQRIRRRLPTERRRFVASDRDVRWAASSASTVALAYQMARRDYDDDYRRFARIQERFGQAQADDDHDSEEEEERYASTYSRLEFADKGVQEKHVSTSQQRVEDEHTRACDINSSSSSSSIPSERGDNPASGGHSQRSLHVIHETTTNDKANEHIRDEYAVDTATTASLSFSDQGAGTGVEVSPLSSAEPPSQFVELPTESDRSTRNQQQQGNHPTTAEEESADNPIDVVLQQQEDASLEIEEGVALEEAVDDCMKPQHVSVDTCRAAARETLSTTEISTLSLERTIESTQSRGECPMSEYMSNQGAGEVLVERVTDDERILMTSSVLNDVTSTSSPSCPQGGEELRHLDLVTNDVAPDDAAELVLQEETEVEARLEYGIVNDTVQTCVAQTSRGSERGRAFEELRELATSHGSEWRVGCMVASATSRRLFVARSALRIRANLRETQVSTFGGRTSQRPPLDTTTMSLESVATTLASFRLTSVVFKSWKALSAGRGTLTIKAYLHAECAILNRHLLAWRSILLVNRMCARTASDISIMRRAFHAMVARMRYEARPLAFVLHVADTSRRRTLFRSFDAWRTHVARQRSVLLFFTDRIQQLLARCFMQWRLEEMENRCVRPFETKWIALRSIRAWRVRARNRNLLRRVFSCAEIAWKERLEFESYADMSMMWDCFKQWHRYATESIEKRLLARKLHDARGYWRVRALCRVFASWQCVVDLERESKWDRRLVLMRYFIAWLSHIEHVKTVLSFCAERVHRVLTGYFEHWKAEMMQTRSVRPFVRKWLATRYLCEWRERVCALVLLRRVFARARVAWEDRLKYDRYFFIDDELMKDAIRGWQLVAQNGAHFRISRVAWRYWRSQSLSRAFTALQSAVTEARAAAKDRRRCLLRGIVAWHSHVEQVRSVRCFFDDRIQRLLARCFMQWKLQEMEYRCVRPFETRWIALRYIRAWSARVQSRNLLRLVFSRAEIAWTERLLYIAALDDHRNLVRTTFDEWRLTTRTSSRPITTARDGDVIGNDDVVGDFFVSVPESPSDSSSTDDDYKTTIDVDMHTLVPSAPGLSSSPETAQDVLEHRVFETQLIGRAFAGWVLYAKYWRMAKAATERIVDGGHGSSVLHAADTADVLNVRDLVDRMRGKTSATHRLRAPALTSVAHAAVVECSRVPPLHASQLRRRRSSVSPCPPDPIINLRQSCSSTYSGIYSRYHPLISDSTIEDVPLTIVDTLNEVRQSWAA